MRRLDEVAQIWPLTHHAYGISVRNLALDELSLLFKDRELSYLYVKKYHQMSVADVREIRELQRERSEHPKVFIISWNLIFRDAQNALLKILEEPADNTYSIIVCPSIRELLPTLQSRLEEVSYVPPSLPPLFWGGNNQSDQLVSIDASQFLKSDLALRFEMIKSFLSSVDEGENGEYHQAAHLFLDELERRMVLNGQYLQSEVWNVLVHARQYLSRNGSSIKMILDLVALYLPQQQE